MKTQTASEPAAVEGQAAKAKPLRILLLEDTKTDAELLVFELRRAGFDPQWERVETEGDFVDSLDPSIDLILADYRLPRFNGLDAFRCLKESGLDIPFIIVSGTLGDELAAECIKVGVSDYLLKDRLGRLGSAATHALEEKRLRLAQHEVENQLRHAQKMEALGQLAGGVAHDFNNVLTVITGWTSLVLDNEKLSPKAQEALHQVYTAGDRAIGLARQLLFFSQKRQMERARVEVNSLIEEVTAMIRRLIGARVTLSLELTDGIPEVDADPSMIEQVLLNLSVNARDAMPQGGNIRLGTHSVELTAGDLRSQNGVKPGQFICIQASDTGTGIPPEILSRIFEPFFTTKDRDKGTGLGLATTLSIVQQHKGFIQVESELGAGTTFSVFLPAAGPAAPAPARMAEHRVTASSGETILIVEDEASVREFAAAVLRPQGYRILQASTGAEGWEVWTRHSERIAALVTDIVMPGDISGPELARRIRAENPAVAVILTSGYNPDSLEIDIDDPGLRFIDKPYTPQRLQTALREVLDRTTQKP